tara:strand:- start:534 stop:737 length:204 start_codon:yes stop_codon:yes gene_type:complete
MKKDNWVAYGIVFGTLVGLFTENLGLWLALGVVLGAGMSEIKKTYYEKIHSTISVYSTLSIITKQSF